MIIDILVCLVKHTTFHYYFVVAITLLKLILLTFYVITYFANFLGYHRNEIVISLIAYHFTFHFDLNKNPSIISLITIFC